MKIMPVVRYIPPTAQDILSPISIYLTHLQNSYNRLKPHTFFEELACVLPSPHLLVVIFILNEVSSLSINELLLCWHSSIHEVITSMYYILISLDEYIVEMEKAYVANILESCLIA
jgi:hypothetical protein